MYNLIERGGYMPLGEGGGERHKSLVHTFTHVSVHVLEMKFLRKWISLQR